MLIDHLILIAPDRSTGIEDVADLTGVRAAIGGQHPAFGTCNALLSIGVDAYLEIMAPDPSLPDPGRPRLFGMDEISAPRLATWVVRTSTLAADRERAVAAGVPLGVIQAGGRRRPDGSEVRWEITDPYAFPAGGVVPFLIHWGATVHPSRSAPAGLHLSALSAEHPDPGQVVSMLAAMGLELPVVAGVRPRLIATLATGRGEVTLGR